jgi:anti-anti-sigma regulatory factor
MLKIHRTTEPAGIVLTVSGRLEAANVNELCESLDALPAGANVVLDLAGLVLADRAVVRRLMEYEKRIGIVLRNCPAYIRTWMGAEDIQ